MGVWGVGVQGRTRVPQAMQRAQVVNTQAHVIVCVLLCV